MMTMGEGRVLLVLACASLALCSWGVPQRALADGDDDLGPLLYERAIGLRAASAGVGLAGRLTGASGTTTPVEEGTITLEGIPDGAEIRHAYLYWMLYGEAPDTDVALDGEAVTGALIGTGGHTCWAANANYDLSAAPNRTFRADVTALVDGDGDYVVSGVASGEADRDAQGASLVIVYVDPGETLLGTVIIRDGNLMVTEEFSSGDFSFDEADEDVVAVAGELHLGVGDGQPTGLDGAINFAGRGLSPTLAGLPMHFDGHSGNYWDANTYELPAMLLERIDDDVTVFNNFQNDCLSYAYGVLAFRTDEPAPPDAGVDAAELDGGTPDAGSGDGGGLDAGRADAGGIDGGVAADAGTIVGSTGGCGCRSTSARGSLGMLGVALALLMLRRR